MRSASQFAFAVIILATVVILLAISTRLEISAVAADNAGWEEMGQGSASGGGISDNMGESGWPSIAAAAGNKPFVSWYDTSGGDKEIYVRRWDGSVWSEVGNHSAGQGGISDNSGDSTAPSIAVGPDGRPCVAWRDSYSGYFEVYLRCWNGSTWIELGANSAAGGGVSNQQGSSGWGPSLAFAPDGTLYVAWDNDEELSNEIYVSRWNGEVWERLPAEGSVSNNLGDSWLPSLAIAPDGTPYVAWQDESSSDSEIYVRRWNGAGWVEVGAGSASSGGISRNSGHSDRASMAISAAGTPYVSWSDESSGNSEIYIRRWNGTVWVEVGVGSATGGGISQDEGDSRNSSLAINESKGPCVAWQDNSQGQNEAYARCWYGSYWSEVNAGSASNRGISSNEGHSSLPALAIGSDGRAYATWGDNSSGNYEIYVRNYLLPDEPPPTATYTPLPTETPTTTPSPTATNTLMPTATPTATSSPTATNTPLPTTTASATFSPTQTPTNTSVPATNTPTSTPRPKANLPIIIFQLPPTPTPTPTRLPLFIGLNARWDGQEFIRTDQSFYLRGMICADFIIRVA